MPKIDVTKTYLPTIDEYSRYLKKIWKSGWVTNDGPMTRRLEKELKDYLGVTHLLAVTNATIGLQIALEVLSIEGEVITTPFSYIATTSSILWKNCTPVFVDIDPKRFCIDANKIEESITKRTTAILAVHVYGFPCEVEKIQQIAKKHNLKVIYDAAHAFGVKYKNKSILEWGDVSVLSFHATKIFHTIEGGGVVVRDKKLAKKVSYVRNFGHKGYDKDYYGVGINGKLSEVHAAMGLSVLPHFQMIVKRRKKIFNLYDTLLHNLPITRISIPVDVEYNYAYYPVIFSSERLLLKVKKALNSHNIFPRRYFYPSLNSIQFINKTDCPVSEALSKRVLCLPLSAHLSDTSVKKIVNLIASQL